ncbi:carboxypeptidase-like regulatory domain-containing protein, partial [Bacteroidetes/Chlorobi group bacterium ChocPot_Mid]
MKTNYKFLLLLIILFAHYDIAISSVLKGKIIGIDENKKKIPLVGATLIWLGTQTGTISKENGFFEIERNNSSNKLVASYIGYGKDTIEIPITKNYLDIELNSELLLDEVTVTGRQSTIIS